MCSLSVTESSPKPNGISSMILTLPKRAKIRDDQEPTPSEARNQTEVCWNFQPF